MRMRRRRLITTVVLAIIIAAHFTPPGHAQSPSPSPSPASVCPRPVITCPQPNANNTWVQINVVPNGSSCRFDPRTIPDLQTSLGGNVEWTFCSTCPGDTKIELEAPGPNGPFNKFGTFLPAPESDTLVKLDMPCNGYSSASGGIAESTGTWKYNLTLKPTGVGLPLDHID